MDYKDLQNLVVNFRDARNWKQFHNPKDMILSLSLEASELLELTQWKSEQEIKDFFSSDSQKLADELADIFYWLLLISNDYKVDLAEALKSKLVENEKKYPLELAKDNKRKYDQLK